MLYNSRIVEKTEEYFSGKEILKRSNLEFNDTHNKFRVHFKDDNYQVTTPWYLGVNLMNYRKDFFIVYKVREEMYNKYFN